MTIDEVLKQLFGDDFSDKRMRVIRDTIEWYTKQEVQKALGSGNRFRCKYNHTAYLAGDIVTGEWYANHPSMFEPI